jgi:hypothetical protein
MATLDLTPSESSMLDETAWKDVIQLRRSKTERAALDPLKVPVQIRHLLPYARVLGGSEDGELADIVANLNDVTRSELFAQVSPKLDEIQACIDDDDSFGDKESYAFICLIRLFDFISYGIGDKEPKAKAAATTEPLASTVDFEAARQLLARCTEDAATKRKKKRE